MARAPRYHLKLMPEIMFTPLWWMKGGPYRGRMTEVILEQLEPPLPKKLRHRLGRWAHEYTEKYISFTRKELERFHREGLEIWDELREALGPKYKVSYFDLRTCRLHDDPKDFSSERSAPSRRPSPQTPRRR